MFVIDANNHSQYVTDADFNSMATGSGIETATGTTNFGN